MKENRLYVDKLIYKIKENGLNKELYEKAKGVLLNKELNDKDKSKTTKVLDSRDSSNIVEYLKKYKISDDVFSIKVKNLGRIEIGEYTINGITPLTGPSDLGKSTILKAMYFAIKICNEYEEEEKDWLKQLENMKLDDIIQKFDIPFSSELEELDEVHKKVVVQELAIKKLVQKFVNSVYSSIFDYINKDTSIELFVNNELVFLMNRESNEVKVTSKSIDAIYVSDSKILNYLSYMTNDSARKIGIKTNIACPDYVRDLKERLSSAYIDTIGWWNNEDGNQLSEYLDIQKIPVVYEENSFKVESSSGQYCRPSEVGDGLKLKSIIHTLAYNGHLNSNTVLLLDEPESSLYPIEYENLINLLRALNCPIGMATHSPSLVEKCSEYSTKSFLAEKINEKTIIKESDSFETITRLLSKVIIEENVNGEL
ncbi:MAG: AAA family ATPase [Sarcina sp.]